MDAAEHIEKLTELTSIQELNVSRAEAVARLTELLDPSEELEVRLTALRAVASYPEHGELWNLTLEIARGEAGELRNAALEALGRIVREGDLAGADEEDYVPVVELGEPEFEHYSAAREVLVACLESPESPEEERAALLSLSYLSEEQSVVEGVDALLASEDEAARIVGLRCVERSGSGRWEAAVCDRLADGSQAEVLAAIGAAGGSERTVTAPLLSRILRAKRQPERHRSAAIHAIACLGGKIAAPALLEVAESDEQSEVADLAREYLASLTTDPSPDAAETAGASS